MAAAVSQASAVTANFDRTDFRDETIYFAMTTRFYDGDPKNNVLCWDGVEKQKSHNDPCWRGDFKGLIEKLDYIKALGFTAIWITPVVQNASGFDYHGYHAMDFSRVDLRYESRKEWGSADDVDFQDLIDAAHAKGIKIILDIVLQHTGNFGENRLCHLFDRDQDIRSQANITRCLIPDEEKLGGMAYWDLPNEGATTQYSERFKYLKNTDGQNHDSNNYWHHVGTGWNWDMPNRWWGQIAGDCVDLNTENPAVDEYIVECYGKFMEMGVDGFRIDTTGHIAPLTFNSYFIPKFIELGEKYKDKRLGGAPFYMFGECCSRFGGVIYRDQHVLSSHYYTWKSDPALVSEWKQYDAEWWSQQFVKEGAAPLGNMLTCEKDPGTVHNSDNVFMKDGAWHEPDYSDASGFNVIDFPMHYNFNNAGQAVRIAKEGDHYYNDASWNVVYVDSHDYSPGPNDGIRFNGGTEQWAENLSLMFTFRGIPCIYYGSEVEFQKGVTIDQGPNLALAESGRAYFGEYLKGDVSASDFGVYTASGNVAQTLNADLAQHIRRLNQIRAAVPALRKGQYTFEGCEADGGWAFKRAWKDSYALVAINGGASFTGVPAGTYVDLVTGDSYTPNGGSITVSAPGGKGQLRVLVKDWTGDKVGEDGMFIYGKSPVAHGGSVTFTDPGTTEYYTYDDAPQPAQVVFNPAGGSFKTETLTVTATLNEGATSGSFTVNGKTETLTKGQSKKFTIGEGVSFGSSIVVTWTADDKSGTVTYRKADPNATITVYVTSPSQPTIYGWGKNSAGADVKPCGAWPGKKLTETKTIDGYDFYSFTFDDMDEVNVIFNNGSSKTGDITGITEDTYFEYDGGTGYKKLDIQGGEKAPVIRATPGNGTKFHDPIDVTLTVSGADKVYYTLNGTQANSSSTPYTGSIRLTSTTTINTYAVNATGETRASFTYTYQDSPVANTIKVYFDAADSGWSTVNAYCWDDNHQEGAAFSGAWPGKALTETIQHNGRTLYVYSFDYEGQLSNPKIIFNCNGSQTGNLTLVDGTVYNKNGASQDIITGVNDLQAENNEVKVMVIDGELVVVTQKATTISVYGVDGTVMMRRIMPGANVIDNVGKGLYIVNGKKVML